MDGMTFKRILAGGAKNFVRGGSVTFATLLIMTVTLTIVGFLIFLSAVLTHTLSIIEDKVDVNVYFTVDAPESQVQALIKDIQNLPEVVAATYTSREDALADFRERHAEDDLTLQALDELGDNPLGASVAIRAQNPTQYEGIVKFLSEESVSGGLIDRINYFQNKVVIDRLAAAIDATQKAGTIIVLLFAFASVIITLATIRLAIHNSRDEIAVMRLVGASNMYIRGPFIVTGILTGLLGAIITLAIFYPVTWYAGSALSTWLGGFNLFSYYLSNFALVAGMILGAGILLGGIASFLAVRRYLRV
ncbi:ABC transporter permease [Patescibacteria group bacterium]|nr:ABC transporter permease [Patescibacteria group bacterium]MBU1755208.1 ABC transporter permease [Patescibacteria group bacterium]